MLMAEGEPLLALSLRRPDLSCGGRSLQAVDRYYRQLSDAWWTYWETRLFSTGVEALNTARRESRPFQPWSAALDFVVTREDDTILSLYLEAVVQGPSPHPLIVRSADTWDVKSGTPRTLSACLPSARKKRKALFSTLKQQAAKQLSGGESLFFSDVEIRVETAFSPERFYLTDDGPVLFYPMRSLGSAAERIPTFSLS